MPVQQQMSTFAKGIGAGIAAANAEHKDKPVDTGKRNLPPGIREGVAKLSSMYTKEYDDDKNGVGTKGKSFFRASAIALSPEYHNGEKVSGLVTSVIIPLCDMPEKGKRKAKSLTENWFDFQNLFKLLGVQPPNETGRDEAAGLRIQAYYFAAMQALTSPERVKSNPVYVSFSTRGWTPAATAEQPKPTEMVFEEWHGLARWSGKVDPGAGVGSSPPPNTLPPTTAPQSVQQPSSSAPPVATATAPEDPADVVAALVEIAMADPEGATEDGRHAATQLEEMAWDVGWNKKQTAGAPDWAAIGDMVLSPPPDTAPQVAPSQGTTSPVAEGPHVGEKFNFAKRTKDGAKLKNNKGEDFPSQGVEVVTVDATAKTCTVKNAKDGKDVVDIRTKKPVDVKFEWLEPFTG